MKTLLLNVAVTLFLSFIGQAQQTMTFSSGAAERGFTFKGWNSNTNIIWINNTSEHSTATCTINSGTWNFVSFTTEPFTSIPNFKVTSNKGDTYSVDNDTTSIHTLNWTGITTVTFTILNGNFNNKSCLFDNFVYSLNTPNTVYNPTTSNISVYPNPIGNKLYLSYTGNASNLKTEFYNVIGKLVKSSVSTTQINVSDLSPGVYLIKVKTEAGTSVQKLIKK